MVILDVILIPYFTGIYIVSFTYNAHIVFGREGKKNSTPDKKCHLWAEAG